MPQFSIIIPVFNKWELTRDCLASLREHDSGLSFEVIVVDNGSTDATATELVPFGKSLFGERFRPVTFPENKNFGPACNAGAQSAKTAVLFFLNNDTLVTPGWAEPLLNALRENDALGAVGPLLLFSDNTVQHLGVVFGTVGPYHLYQHFPENHPVIRRTANRDYQCITGAALMLRADLFHECGGFFEDYKNGFEDLDLCVQLRKRGKILRCIPESRIYHLESQTPNRAAHNMANSQLFTRRCGGDIYIDAHHHALRDGFDVFITDMLTLGMRLGEKEEAELFAKAEGKDVAEWARLMRENPFWIKGREVLAQSLEQAGRQRDAIPLRVELTDIEPFFARYRDLARLIPFALPDAQWPQTIKRHLAIMEDFAANKEAALNILHRARKRYVSGRDAFLEDLYMDKLRRMFPE